MKVAILAPIATSLYSRVVTYGLSREPGIEVTAVIVRSPWSWKRVRSEFRRDGARLIRKIAQKMVLRDDRFGNDDRETLREVARGMALPGRSLRDLTSALGIALTTCDDHNAPSAVETLARSTPDLVVFTGGGLLRPKLLSVPRLGTLNCHMGLLPRFRGMDVVEWTALEEGTDDPGIGVTVHYMDSGVDTGAILSKHRTELRPSDDFASIRRRMERDMAFCMMQTVRDLRDGTIEPQPQAAGEGRQYFVMHPTIMEIARRRLKAQLGSGTHGTEDSGEQASTRSPSHLVT